MPIEATQHTPAGARAFAKFFLQTVDWGYATTSSTYMRRYFQPSCQTCRVVKYSLDNARRDGKHYVGGRVTVLRVEQAKRGGAERAEVSARAVVNISAIEVLDRRGRASSPDVAYTNYGQSCGLRWLHASWQVVSLMESKS